MTQREYFGSSVGLRHEYLLIPSCSGARLINVCMPSNVHERNPPPTGAVWIAAQEHAYLPTELLRFISVVVGVFIPQSFPSSSAARACAVQSHTDARGAWWRALVQTPSGLPDDDEERVARADDATVARSDGQDHSHLPTDAETRDEAERVFWSALPSQVCWAFVAVYVLVFLFLFLFSRVLFVCAS
jgi:hypothetical protein